MNKDLTICGLQEKRNTIERRISNLIQEFFAETGVMISGVKVSVDTLQTIEGYT